MSASALASRIGTLLETLLVVRDIGTAERRRIVADVLDRVALPAAAAASPAASGGCPYRSRCAIASARCAAEIPRPRDMGGGHQVACHAAMAPPALPSLH